MPIATVTQLAASVTLCDKRASRTVVTVIVTPAVTSRAFESAEEAEAEMLAEAYDNAVAEIDGQVIDATSDAGEFGNANGSFDSSSKNGLES